MNRTVMRVLPRECEADAFEAGLVETGAGEQKLYVRFTSGGRLLAEARLTAAQARKIAESLLRSAEHLEPSS